MLPSGRLVAKILLHLPNWTRKVYALNFKRQESAREVVHAHSSTKNPAKIRKARGKESQGVDHNQDPLLQVPEKRLANSGRQAIVIVERIAPFSILRRQCLQKKTNERRRRRKRSHAKEVKVAQGQAPTVPLGQKARGRKVENLLLPMRRQPFASCGHWSLLQRSRTDQQHLLIARWEAWSCQHTLPCLF